MGESTVYDIVVRDGVYVDPCYPVMVIFSRRYLLASPDVGTEAGFG
jgi:hypothetical protein